MVPVTLRALLTFSTILLRISLAHGTLTTSTALPACTADSAPNPIASIYPYSVTGTINETIVVLPIHYDLARRIIPSQYKILSGYKSLLPKLDDDYYPLVLETTIDHDVQVAAYGFTLADFSSVRFSFPFIDLLGDGFTNFRYSPTIYLSANPVAIAGAEAYGQTAIASIFDPSCAGYAPVKDEKAHDDDDDASDGEKDEIYFDVYPETAHTSPLISARFHHKNDTPYPLSFFKNVTNQPSFANGSSCDNMIRFFNTSVTTGAHAPQAIRGRVALRSADVLPESEPETFWRGVYGFVADTAFVENNYVPCEGLRGYGGVEGEGEGKGGV